MPRAARVLRHTSSIDCVGRADERRLSATSRSRLDCSLNKTEHLGSLAVLLARISAQQRELAGPAHDVTERVETRLLPE